MLWKIDEYLELSSDQKAFVRERLRVLLAQHRAEALPIYEGFLVEVKEKIANGVDRQEIEWMFSTYEALRVDLFQRLVPDGAALLSSLTDKQVRYLETRLERDSHKTARRLQDDTDSRLSARASTTLDWLKDWLGPLTKAQQLRIAELSRALPDMVPARMDHQRHWHREFIELLTSTREPQSISRYLKRSLFFPERTVRPDYQYAIHHINASVKEMILAIDPLVTTEQRAHALTKLQRLIDDVHALANRTS